MNVTHQIVPTPAPTTEPRPGLANVAGEGVRAMTRFDRFRRRRVLDESSQLDRMIVLEAVRRRRQAAAIKSAVELEVSRARGLR